MQTSIELGIAADPTIVRLMAGRVAELCKERDRLRAENKRLREELKKWVLSPLPTSEGGRHG